MRTVERRWIGRKAGREGDRREDDECVQSRCSVLSDPYKAKKGLFYKLKMREVVLKSP